MNVTMEISDDNVIQILEQYHGLVRYIARRTFHSSSVTDLKDLHQVGDLAVLRAVKAYNPSSGCNIKSFVSNAIRNAIFNEAARFLGVITVDFTTTAQASYAFRMHEKGKSDKEIAVLLTNKYGRKFDSDHARDLRLTYSRRTSYEIDDSVNYCDLENDISIRDILESVIENPKDKVILFKRILGNKSLEDVMDEVCLSKIALIKREHYLKDKIKKALE